MLRIRIRINNSDPNPVIGKNIAIGLERILPLVWKEYCHWFGKNIAIGLERILPSQTGMHLILTGIWIG